MTFTNICLTSLWDIELSFVKATLCLFDKPVKRKRNIYSLYLKQLPFTLFFDRGTASLCCSLNDQGTGEGHELLNTDEPKTVTSVEENTGHAIVCKQMSCTTTEKATIVNIARHFWDD